MTDSLATTAIAERSPWQTTSQWLRCVRTERETHDVATLVFQADTPTLFEFKPGQFVTVELPIDGQKVTRCYSVSSSPARPLSFSITVKRVSDGTASNWLHDRLRVGDDLRISGPQGAFNLIDRPARKVLMLSGGSGITPVMSMLRWVHDTAADIDIAFVHAARTPADVVFRDELEAIARRNPGVRLSLMCEDDAGHAWSGHRGRIDAATLQTMVPDLAERTVYTCGPEPFMRAARSIVAALGVPAAQYHEESFGGGPPEGAADKPIESPQAEQGDVDDGDTAVADHVEAAAACSVRLQRTGSVIECKPDETLLEAAERNNAWIPCGCRMGVCGSCKVYKQAGTVEMEHMGGLGADEESGGYILACCSYPVESVEIDV